MPELPEVETIRIELEKHVVGGIINDVIVRTPTVVHGDCIDLIGAQITAARRASKLLLLDTSLNFSIAIHLKMTGRIIFDDPHMITYRKDWEYDYETSPHTHVIFNLNDNKKLYFNDYRRFGTVDIISTEKVNQLQYVKTLGKEFFKDLTEEEFSKAVGKSSRAIKVILLDQSVVAGVGNIYANEALWEAQIHPETSGKLLTRNQKNALFHALEEVMKQSIEYKGASSDNFRDLFGSKGTSQDHFSVYGREDEKCLRCAEVVKKYFLGGRGTYFCPVCQKKNPSSL